MYRKFLIALMSETMIDVQVSRGEPEMSSIMSMVHLVIRIWVAWSQIVQFQEFRAGKYCYLSAHCDLTIHYPLRGPPLSVSPSVQSRVPALGTQHQVKLVLMVADRCDPDTLQLPARQLPGRRLRPFKNVIKMKMPIL